MPPQSCQEELKQLKAENHQLREKLQLQQKEFELQKEFLTRKKDVQPSKTQFLPGSVNFDYSVESIAMLWEWESSGPVPQNLFRLHEL